MNGNTISKTSKLKLPSLKLPQTAEEMTLTIARDPWYERDPFYCLNLLIKAAMIVEEFNIDMKKGIGFSELADAIDVSAKLCKRGTKRKHLQHDHDQPPTKKRMFVLLIIVELNV